MDGNEWMNGAIEMGPPLNFIIATNEWMNWVIEMGLVMAIIEIIENFHFNETWQSYTKAYGNCHVSLIVVAATTHKWPYELGIFVQ